MRTANHKLIQQLESERRASAYGTETKTMHMVIVAVLSATLFAVKKVRHWWYHAPPTEVVLDNVIVEVYEDDSGVDLGHISAVVCLMSLAAIALLRLWGGKGGFLDFGAKKSSHPPTKPLTAPAPEAAKESSALKPRDAQWWSGGAGGPIGAVGGASSTVAGPMDRSPITSLNQLDTLIASGDSRTRPVPNTTSSSPFGSFMPVAGRQPLSSNGGNSNMVAVRYDSATEGRAVKSRQGNAESELAALSVVSVERSTARLKEWLSGICCTVVDEIDRCDRWFADKRYSAFDCTHPLTEWHEIPAPPRPAAAATGGWGMPLAGATVPQATTEKIRKSTALDNERRKLQAQPAASTETYDMIGRLEQRLALERVLDTSITFPCSELSAAAAHRRQAAVLKSLRSFASSRQLSVGRSGPSSSLHATGDAPADAYLLVHILRIRVPSLSSYLRLPYDTTAAAPQELLLYVGGNGEPYFYVKHRTGSQEHIMKTAEGPESLFEALLLFFAVVRRYYGGSYGNVTGIVDLKQLGLDAIF